MENKTIKSQFKFQYWTGVKLLKIIIGPYTNSKIGVHLIINPS